MANLAEFDIGPLTWVKGEIDQALARALAALRAFVADPEDLAQIRYSRTHFHQAHGALQIVGLDGVARFSEELEGLLGDLADGGPREDAVAASERGFAAISAYLEQLLAGEPNQPLKLFGIYGDILRARGKPEPDPVDLYFPDLGARPPKRPADAPIPSAETRSTTMREQHAQFQRALLGWLRKEQDGARKMAAAIARIEAVETAPPLRAFWWAAHALMEAVASGSVTEEQRVARVANRIERQMKRLLDGSANVAERLTREVLFHVARAQPSSAPIREVQNAFGLAGSIPEKLELESDGAAHLPRLRAMREVVMNAKNAWTRFASGHTPTVAPFCEHAVMLRDRSAGLGRWELARLAEEMVAIADGLIEVSGPIDETLALEVATALLLFEDAIDKFNTLPAEFTRQCQAMITRLRAYRGEVTGGVGTPAPILQDIARRAQERMAIAQLVTEIQSNLRVVEQGLDAFFRDPDDRAGLKALDKPIAQVIGAFRILNETRAADALEDCATLVHRFSDPGYQPQQFDFEYVAGVLSGLGFYAEALQHGRADFEAAMQPVRDRRAELAADADEVTGAEPASLETQLVEEQRVTQALLDEWRADPTNEAKRAALLAKLEGLHHDAHLVADGELEARAREAIAILERTGAFATQPDLANAIGALQPEPAMATPAPASSPELVAAPTEVIDAELLEIFLQEATEMLSTIHEYSERARRTPGNTELLVPIRRAFHTLKGSGRMVGLTRIGEAAWACEQLLNNWLDLQRPPTEELLGVVQAAERYFSDAVVRLKNGDQLPDEAMLVAMAHNLRTDEPGVMIGGRRISNTLYNIFLSEARAHLASLEEAHKRIVPGRPVGDDYHRAAHTLAGIAGTVNFASLRELALALESALERVTEAPSAEACEVFGTTVGVLDSMVGTIAGRNEPPRAIPLLAQLGAIGTSAAPISGRPGESRRDDAPSVPTLSLVESRPVSDTSATVTALFGGDATKDAEAANEALDFSDAPERPSGEVPPTVVAESAPQATEPESPIEFDWDEPAPIPAETAPEPSAAAPVAPDFTLDLPDFADETPREVAEAPAAPTFELPEIEPVAPVLASAPPASPASPAAPPAAPAEPVADSTPAVTPSAEDGPDLRVAVPDEPPPRAPAVAAAAVAAASAAGAMAARPPVGASGDDIDAQLLPVFLEEGQELMPAIGSTLRDWRDHAHSPAAGHALQRLLHTLKGSARMAGAMTLGQMLHGMETRVEEALAQPTLPPNLFDELEGAYDEVSARFDALASPPVPATAEPAAATPAAAAAAASVPTEQRPAPAAPATAESERVALLRVRAENIDRLVNEAGEVAIARSRIEGEMRVLKSALGELNENVSRLRNQLREIEIQAESQIQSRLMQSKDDLPFDPLEFDRFTRFQELTRMMAESVNDVATVQGNISRSIDETESALSVQARLSRDLQQDLLRVRMMPFQSIAERLYRTVRQAAKETGKRAVLEIRNGQVELDRSVLERITAPFEHMLRNALAHGLESAADRRAAGKSEVGDIRIEVRQEGNEVAIAVSDDGGGLDYARIRAKGVSLGLLGPEDEPDESEIAELIFQPGFTTADEVTELAGRGVGMDVVKSEIAGLGGRVEVSSRKGAGTTFGITLPLTLAVTQAVLVSAGGAKYVIPAVMVEQVRQLQPAELAELYQSRVATWQGRRSPFYYLPRLFGDLRAEGDKSRVGSVAFVRSGSNTVAVHVDEMLGNHEIVVKNTGPLLARIAGITGATVLGSGEIVLIINPVILAQREVQAIAAATPPAEPVQRKELDQPTVLIVDDSLTVRKITGRLLQREGYRVLTARDGVDALEQLADLRPDVMLVDIEMPRMDGFDLTRNVRADERLKDVPIIMITSRTAEKHRNYALEIGVNVYLGKPYRDDELLSSVASFLGDRAPHGADTPAVPPPVPRPAPDADFTDVPIGATAAPPATPQPGLFTTP
jgi:chemosensory pili system protein ChpA (sensor histidine kinase/response regulator)